MRVLSLSHRLPYTVDNSFKFFMQSVFEKEVEYRLSAADCLSLDFFTQHTIPHTLPDHIFSQPYRPEDYQKEASSIVEGNFDFGHERTFFEFVLFSMQLIFQRARFLQAKIKWNIRKSRFRRSRRCNTLLKMQNSDKLWRMSSSGLMPYAVFIL